MIPQSEVESLKFNYEAHWISRQCNAGLPFVDVGPLLTGIVKFGLVWDIVWLAYAITRWEQTTAPFLTTWGLVLLWVNLAPYFIWLYDQVVMPQFYDKFLEMTSDRADIEDIAQRYNRFFAKPRIATSLLWAGAVLLVAWAGTPMLQEMGMSGDGVIFLWTAYAYAIFIGGVLGGPGFMGPITTVLMIREIADTEFDIQPLHPDQLGGLSNVGYCAIRTTLLYSTASLFFPLGFQLAADSNRRVWVITVLGFYILTVVFSFLYPTIKINRKAARIRADILDDLRQQAFEIQSRLNELNDETKLTRISLQLELQRVRSKYADYNNVRLYPLQIDIFIKLAASVFLPFLMIFLEFYMLQWLG